MNPNVNVSIGEIRASELPENGGIYFLETNKQRKGFTVMDLCAFESAAALNPDHDVYVIIDNRDRKKNRGILLFVYFFQRVPKNAWASEISKSRDRRIFQYFFFVQHYP